MRAPFALPCGTGAASRLCCNEPVMSKLASSFSFAAAPAASAMTIPSQSRSRKSQSGGQSRNERQFAQHANLLLPLPIPSHRCTEYSLNGSPLTGAGRARRFDRVDAGADRDVRAAKVGRSRARDGGDEADRRRAGGRGASGARIAPLTRTPEFRNDSRAGRN